MNDKISKNGFKMPEEQFGENAQTEQPSHLGVILGVLVLVLMLILGGLYLWGRSMQTEMSPVPTQDTERPTAEENNEPESTNAESDVETAAALSPSDELEAIQADIDATRLDTLNQEIPAIEAEILQ